MTWVGRLRRACPIAAISVELVKFDTQLMEHAEISGVEYQQGTLQGYEVREYLLEKWGRQCAYCDATGVPLADRTCLSSLTLWGEPCGQPDPCL